MGSVAAFQLHPSALSQASRKYNHPSYLPPVPISPIMKLPTIIAAASLFLIHAACQLSAKDTVDAADYARFDAIMALTTGETYFGYGYTNDSVSIIIHDANTDEIIAQDTFRSNGKAVEYLLQSDKIEPAQLSADGPVEDVSAMAKCTRPPVKREADLFERASRCSQFCARGSSCTVDRRCRACRYVMGLCRWQKWCVP
jgi:hypothetical protein